MNSDSTVAEHNQPPLRSTAFWLAIVFSLFGAGVGILYCGRTKLAVCVALTNLILAACLVWILLYGPAWMLSLPLLLTIVAIVYIANIIVTWNVASTYRPMYIARDTRTFVFYAAWQAVAIGCTYLMLQLFGEPQSFKIPSEAMADTLIVGDTFIAGMSAYADHQPERGDIVVFLWPGDGRTKYVKRCVGLPGDTIEIRDTTVYLNGAPQPRPATAKFIDLEGHLRGHYRIPSFLGQNERDYFGPYVVPTDSYFMLGDNRDNSSDSRIWGPVHRDLLLGKAIRIISSDYSKRIGAPL